jgi:hypothetical protein
MTYRGTVKDGVVILESGASLPDGAQVRIEPVDEPDSMASLREGLLRFAGTIKGMPADSARNHDHYL